MTYTPLWQTEHDYYGPEAPYWGRPDQYRDYIQTFESWGEFVTGESMYTATKGLNLLYRWDWNAPDPSLYMPGETVPTEHELELFWMLPRKGIMARACITVTPEDEPAVRAWLLPHWEYMRSLWEPLS